LKKKKNHKIDNPILKRRIKEKNYAKLAIHVCYTILLRPPGWHPASLEIDFEYISHHLRN